MQLGDVQRKEICKNCSNLIDKRCELCGCYMPLKVINPFSKCPINKW